MNKLFLLATLVAVIPYAALAQPAKIDARLGISYTLSPGETSLVEASMRARMRDPTSAQFIRLVGSKNATGRITICGLVNAKNGFGGYSGSQVFMGELTGTAASPGFLFHGMGENWQKRCKDYGAGL